MKRWLFSLLFFCATLQAAGWGPKSTTHVFEGVRWHDVYYHMKKLSFEAVVPNYSTLRNDFGPNLFGSDVVNMVGFIDNRSYLVQTFHSSIANIKSGKKFKRLVEEAYPGIVASWLDAKKMGAEYAVEFTYVHDGKLSYWRVIYKNRRLVNLASFDEDPVRRNHFFDSFRLI